MSVSPLLVDYALKASKALVILVAGYIASRSLSAIVEKSIGKELSPHLAKVSRNAVFYLIIGITVVTATGQFIDLTAIIAAAGIAGVAIGFASRTSLSNVIAGLFLIVDRPFEIGDAIEIGGDRGVVVDISLLSTRMRTFDNRYLRVPNESVVNSKIINLTKYEIRRIDLPVSIAYKEDVGKAVELITSTVKNNQNVLIEPEPLVVVNEFGESGIALEVRAWVQRTEFFQVKNQLVQEIKKALDEADIEIPFPHRTVYVAKMPEK